MGRTLPPLIRTSSKINPSAPPPPPLPLRQYNLKSFCADLKEVLRRCGVEGKRVLLFIEDHNLVDPACLELVNSLMSGGKRAHTHHPNCVSSR